MFSLKNRCFFSLKYKDLYFLNYKREKIVNFSRIELLDSDWIARTFEKALYIDAKILEAHWNKKEEREENFELLLCFNHSFLSKLTQFSPNVILT